MLKVLFKRRKNDNSDKDSVIDIINRIQCGDVFLKENFIHQYNPFIIKTVSSTLGKYIEVENSEEYSIALSAFNEAIECFNEKKSCNFFSFSEQVIKRKLYTFLNARKKELNTIPFSYFEQMEVNFEDKYLTDSGNELHNIEIKDQYDLFEEKLAEFGIHFEDLVLQRPKHKDSMLQAIKVAKLLSEDRNLYQKLMKKKTIPMVELINKIKINHKAIERNRKFIISVCIILGEGFEDIKSHIKEYVNQ